MTDQGPWDGARYVDAEIMRARLEELVATCDVATVMWLGGIIQAVLRGGESFADTPSRPGRRR